MRKMAAGSFKVHCLAVMDEVQAKRETVVITKHGKPAAKLVPADKNIDDIYDFLAGKGAITGDVVSPQFQTTIGESSSDSPRHPYCRLAGV
jgi:prevent-host-death family protein